MVLASLTFFRPGKSCPLPTVRNRHLQGAPAGFRSFRGHERYAEVPDSPRWSLDWPPAMRTHLVSWRLNILQQRWCIDDLVQNCSISSALAMEILQFCTKPWICWLIRKNFQNWYKYSLSPDGCFSAQQDVLLYVLVQSQKHRISV